MNNSQNLLNQALRLHQSGQIREAINLYNKLLLQENSNAQLLFLLGTANIQVGQRKIAIEQLEQSLVFNPQNAHAHYNLGSVFNDLKRLDEALANYDKVLTLLPDYAEAYNNRGGVLSDLKRLDEALASYDMALSLKPDYVEAYNNRGNILNKFGRLDEALASFNKALTFKPDYAVGFNNRGNALMHHERLDEALVSFDNALALKPDYAEAFYNRANALSALKRQDEALASYAKVLALKPDYADALYNRGNVLSDLKRLDEALESFNRALALRPDYTEAYNNRGYVFLNLKRHDEALASFDKALALKPGNAEIFNNRGNVLKELKRLDEALTNYNQAVVLKPDYADAYNNRGSVLSDRKRLDEALASYDKALALNPGFAAAYNNRGNALSDLKRLDEALVSYDKALTYNPDYADAYNNRGYVLLDLKRMEAAQVSFEKALALNPDLDFLFGMVVYTTMRLCDWASLDVNRRRLVEAVSQSRPVTTPLHLHGLVDSPALHLTAAKVYVNTKHPRQNALGAVPKRPPDGKIRVGYYSADFHNHATAYLMAELFEAHDPAKFEWYGFTFGPPAHDDMRQRVASAFYRFLDVRDRSDREVAQVSRALGIDIAVDLKGYTQDARTGIFAEGAAPIQVNYLGYPGTMGAEYIDYIIADRTVIPPECQVHYTEKVVYLPHSYQVNDSKRKISDRAFTKREFGLPETGFVFCCFNNNFKILPATFDGWMRLLTAVDGSVLWLLEDNPAAAVFLRQAAEARGVDSRRLVFAKRLPLEEHLARHRLADLFIDTLPYNAHTTTSDALWAGLPVLTCLGESFASRVGASLLNAVGLPELITGTQSDYEARAIELATNPDKLAAIRHTLARNRLTAPLFDGTLFARHIEAAYAAMHARQQAGLPPAAFDIAS